MKKLIIVFFSLMAILFVACDASPKKLLQRKWKFVDLLVPGKSDAERQAIIKEGRFEFKPDGTYTSFTVGKEVDGKYTLSDDGKTLTLSANSGTKYDVTVTELTSKKFVGVAVNTTIVCEPE